ncbi:MAG: NUDIX hydrolase [Pseudomonadota bacterium]
MGKPPDIETLSQDVVFESRWIRLREDRIRRRDGALGTYAVVEKPDFAVIAAIEDGQIHMVEQFRYPIGRRVWELPMGAAEPGADDLAETARRELAEETGLGAARIERIGRLHPAYGYSSHAFELFLATGLTEGTKKRDDEEQDMISRPFPLAQVFEMARDGTIVDGPTVAALALLALHGKLSLPPA